MAWGHHSTRWGHLAKGEFVVRLSLCYNDLMKRQAKSKNVKGELA
jgi:hypothetical protein